MNNRDNAAYNEGLAIFITVWLAVLFIVSGIVNIMLPDRISAADIDLAETLCKNNEGVQHIDEIVLTISVRCKDGALYGPVDKTVK